MIADEGCVTAGRRCNNVGLAGDASSSSSSSSSSSLQKNVKLKVKSWGMEYIYVGFGV